MKVNVEYSEKLIKALKNAPIARVGVLTGKDSRANSESNATIGMKHEFGIGVAKRSFLRMPLIEKFQKELEAAGFDEDVVKKSVEEGSLRDMVAMMGVIGVNVTLSAFDSGGFGRWAPHAPGYTNNTGMILVDTQQLRDSIISEVIE